MVFTIFSCFFVKKNPKESFSLLLWKHLLIVKIIPVILFRCSEAAILIMKKLTGTHLWTEISYRKLPRTGQRRKLTNESWYRNYDAASGTILDLVSVFKGTNRNFKFIIFFWTRQAKNLKTIWACKESTDFNY